MSVSYDTRPEALFFDTCFGKVLDDPEGYFKVQHHDIEALILLFIQSDEIILAVNLILIVYLSILGEMQL